MSPLEQEPILMPSKRDIRMAGDILRHSNEQEIEWVDKMRAMKLLSEWRQLHSYPINTFQSYFRKVVKKHYPKAIVAQRLKRAPSIITKLQRFPDMQLDRMQDICGFRIVLAQVTDVYSLLERFSKSKTFKHKLILPHKDYIEHPKKDGYRSVHQVFKYNNKTHPELNKLRTELQIRTALQHYWATAVETLGFIEQSSFKTGEGSDDMKRFFRLSSTLFAKHEQCPVEAEFEDTTALCHELRSLDEKLQICNKLKGLAFTARQIEQYHKEADAYHLMELNLTQPHISLKSFSKNQLSDAEALYRVREEATANNPNISIVLISAGNIRQIKKAYPNYFMDTNHFTSMLQKLLKGISRNSMP